MLWQLSTTSLSDCIVLLDEYRSCRLVVYLSLGITDATAGISSH